MLPLTPKPAPQEQRATFHNKNTSNPVPATHKAWAKINTVGEFSGAASPFRCPRIGGGPETCREEVHRWLKEGSKITPHKLESDLPGLNIKGSPSV